MPIDLTVAGDPSAIAACADSMNGAAGSIHTGAENINQGRQNSESEWTGPAGDAFRTHAKSMVGAADGLHTTMTTCATAVQALADALTTVKAQMRAAADHAAGVGLDVTYAGKDPSSIAEPREDDSDSSGLACTMADALKWGAYRDAQSMVATARTIEGSAHTALMTALEGVKTAAHDMATNNAWTFALAGAGTTYVASVVDKYDKLASKAKEFDELAEKLSRTEQWALEHGRPSDIAVTKYLLDEMKTSGSQAAKEAEFTSKFLAGQAGKKAVQTAGRLFRSTIGDFTNAESIAGRAGRFVPLFGAGLAAAQTTNDVAQADSTGEKVQVASADAGSFVAGSVATELLMGSAVAGPVGIGAVAVGVGVAFATSELINHWDDIF